MSQDQNQDYISYTTEPLRKEDSMQNTIKKSIQLSSQHKHITRCSRHNIGKFSIEMVTWVNCNKEGKYETTRKISARSGRSSLIKANYFVKAKLNRGPVSKEIQGRLQEQSILSRKREHSCQREGKWTLNELP